MFTFKNAFFEGSKSFQETQNFAPFSVWCRHGPKSFKSHCTPCYC